MKDKKAKGLVIYHSADMDGHLSGFICGMGLREKRGIDDIEYLGYDYHEPVEKVIDRINELRKEYSLYVTMSDISLESKDGRNRMDEIEDLKYDFDDWIECFIWIDHHKTAIESNSDKINGVRKDGIAACMLSWNYFFNPLEPSDAVTLAAQYDVWNKDGVFIWDSEVIPAQYYFRSLNTNPDSEEGRENIGFLLNTTFDQLIKNGKSILSYEKEQAKRTHFFEVEFEGEKFICANKKQGSSLFEFAGKKGDSLMAFSVGDYGFSFSLYAGEKDVDLSAIAKKWGGGGHKKACGFKTDFCDGVEIIKGGFK